MKNLMTLLLLALLTSCSEESNSNPESQLPPITQTGANTFGCLIDGKLVKPRDGSGSIGGSNVGASFYGGYPNATDYYELDIRDLKSNKTSKILIHMQNVHLLGAGNYIINESNGMSSIDGYNHNYIHCRVFDQNTNSYQFYRSFENSGVLIITKYDFYNRVISGTFSCQVKNSANATDIIEITNGRFDIKWDTLPNVVFP
jgi:hypothetical protein